MANYQEVMREVEQRVHALVAKQAGLSEAEALSRVFKEDPQLYRHYTEASAHQPPPSPPPPRPAPAASGANAEAMQRAQALVAKSSGLSLSDALSQVFKADPSLYRRYIAKQDGTPAPTFGSELLTRQMDDLYEMVSALVGALRGIISSDAPDKGAKIQTALGEFTTAVLNALRQAGLSVPAEKRASGGLIPAPVEAAILAAALAIAPRDALGAGMTQLRKIL